MKETKDLVEQNKTVESKVVGTFLAFASGLLFTANYYPGQDWGRSPTISYGACPLTSYLSDQDCSE